MAQVKKKRSRRASSSTKSAAAANVPDAKEPTVMGRPTGYRPEYCRMLINHNANGRSFESFGAVVGVNRDTLYDWARLHPEFSDAKGQGRAMLIDFWEGAAARTALGIQLPLPADAPPGTKMNPPNARLLEYLLKVHGKEAGFQDDGSNKGMGLTVVDPKDTTINFQYVDGVAPKKVDDGTD